MIPAELTVLACGVCGHVVLPTFEGDKRHGAVACNGRLGIAPHTPTPMTVTIYVRRT